MKIENIFIHHSGGLGNDNFASTLQTTPQDISKYHKARWNFASQYIKDETLRYTGYNVVYDPKTRKFTQCRAIGEETAAVIGYNFNSFHLCIIGNYNKKPLSTESVDPMFTYMVEDITHFLIDLINNNARNLIVAKGLDLKLSKTRIFPHRKAANTMCYGTSLDDNFFLKKVTEYKAPEPKPVNKTPNGDVICHTANMIPLEKHNEIVAKYDLLVSLIRKLFSDGKIVKGSLGVRGIADRDDPENFDYV